MKTKLLQTRTTLTDAVALHKLALSEKISDAAYLRRLVHQQVAGTPVEPSYDNLDWVPREYPLMDTVVTERPFAAEAVVQMVPRIAPVPGSGLPGHPELQQQNTYGVERPFRLEHIVVDDECAPHLSITRLYVGGDSLLRLPSTGAPASIFAESVPRCPLPRVVIAATDIFISIYAVNNTNQPRMFKGRLVGHEGVPKTKKGRK